MPAIRQGDKNDSVCGVWITIGSLDGIHKGHQHILRELVKGAHAFSQSALVITFYPNPAEVLRNIKDAFYLSTPEEKDRMLKALGVDSILTIHFDQALSRMSAEDFIRILHSQLHFSCLLIGHDFRMGSNREGDIHTLKRIGDALGYFVRSISPLQQSNIPISSSLIREAVRKGEMEEAADLLGGPYEIQGRIIHGDGRGKHIGLPTANVAPWEKKIVPARGVYAAFAIVDGVFYQAVVNIGFRPTFYEQPLQSTIEAHLLDFKEDIYDKSICLIFIRQIRAEKRFASAEALMTQIRQDIQTSREVLTHVTPAENLSA